MKEGEANWTRGVEESRKKKNRKNFCFYFFIFVIVEG